MNEAMLFTFICLISAHLAADFPLQTNRMVQQKNQISGLSAHGAIVAITTCIALGATHWIIWGTIVISHIAMDWIKSRALPDRAWAFWADQGFHLSVIAIAAIIVADSHPWFIHSKELTIPLVYFTAHFAASSGSSCALSGNVQYPIFVVCPDLFS
jgi:hypothetical protein